MYHSIDFELFPSHGSGSLKFNTYDDLYLVPTSRPTISPPSVNTKSIEIPGANGALDLTESITPYPTYKNRTGSIDFAVLNDKMDWTHLYSKLLNYLHGRYGKMILEDDQNWFYEGRFAVNNWSPGTNADWSTVSIDYDLKPYKLSITTSIEDDYDWLWNPFSFYDGVIHNKINKNYTATGLFTDIEVDSSNWILYGEYVYNPSTEIHDIKIHRGLTGWMPVSPTVITSSRNMGIKIVNDQLGYTYEKTYSTSGEHIDPELIFYDWVGTGYQVYLKGSGTVTILFRKGSL